jgi:hypothetical protein
VNSGARLLWVGFALLALSLADARAREKDEPVRLRLTFVQSTPVTTISIGGRAVQVIVDTSAGDADGALTLSHDIIQDVRAIRLGNAVMNDAHDRQFIRPRFRLPLVIVDGREYRDVNVVEALPPQPGEQSPTPNVMGKWFLGRHFVVVDFAARTISLWPRRTRDPVGIDCGRTRIPMERTNEARLAVSTFDLRAGRVRLAWSTGAAHSFLAEATAKRLQLETAEHGPGSPEFFEATPLAAGGKNVGRLEFVVLPLALPGDFAGVIGGDFFDHHVVCFDYRRHEIRVR